MFLATTAYINNKRIASTYRKMTSTKTQSATSQKWPSTPSAKIFFQKGLILILLVISVSGAWGQTTVWSDNFDGTDTWTKSGNFGIGTQTINEHSGTKCLYTVQNGNYGNGVNEATNNAISSTINCAGFYSTQLSFWSQSDFEVGYDYGYVYISSDNGGTWILVEKFDGNETAWTLHTIDISSVASDKNQVKVKFTMSSDGSQARTGWNIDDLAIKGTKGFYSKGNLQIQLPSSWNTKRDGSGSDATAADFTSGSRFIVQNAHTMTATAAWNVSGTGSIVQIENGGTITENTPITLSANITLQVDNGGTLNHNVNSTSIFGGSKSFGSTSTVVYGFAGVQNVEAGLYGNLTIDGGGTKTMQGNITVSGTLSLTNGNLSLGSGTYNLTLPTGATVTGAFDNTHMVVCDGTGSIIKQGTAAADFVRVYPVGTVTNYTPYEISSLTASISGTGSMSIRAVPTIAPGTPSAASTDLTKYWAVATNNISAISANLKLTYVDPTEIGLGGNQTKYIPYYYNSTTLSWSIPAVASSAGVNPMTVSGTSSLSGQWTAREEPAYTTYYSYQSGPWSTAATWTTDPSGTLSVDPKVPTATDRVVILNGRTVTTTANGYEVLSVQINEGGTLNLGTFTTQTFTAIRGQGLVRLQNSAFPTGDWSNFVSAGGGTVEYYNTASFSFSQLVYNNLIVNLNTNALVASQLGNMTINGNFAVTRGKFQINDGTANSRSLSVAGNVTVGSNGSIGLGTGNANHRFVVKGDFTNDGSVIFTEFNAADYRGFNLNYATADVVFSNPTADQSLQCNGTSNFYRIEIDKGTDQTYILNIDASNSANFNLFGRNDTQNSPPDPNTPGALTNENALGLLAGTVRLGPNITIPSLCNSGIGNGVYNIDLDAQLWLDGATITTSNVSLSCSPIVYGKVKLTNNATWTDNGDQGFILREQSSFEMESGTISTPCIRTSAIVGTHRGAFNISGGTITITGNNYASTGEYASFTMPYPDNVFRMSGGVINILAPTTSTDGANGVSFSLLLGPNTNNVTVTGGAINITVPTTRNAYINTTVPLWNLNITSSSSTYRAQIQPFAGNGDPYLPVIAAQPLVVYNDLDIQNSAVFNANWRNVTVGRNFTINVAAEYETANNTTTFNGSTGQRFTNAGTVNNGTGLYNLTIAGSSNTDIFTNNLIVRGNLDIQPNCFLNDVGHSVSVLGNITNSGTHTSQGSGAIRLNGTTNQSIGGSGLGLFGNLNLNNTTGATLTANQAIAGNLRLASGILDVGSFNLALGASSNVYDALTGTSIAFSATKMIKLAGFQSDGGVTKTYGNTANFLYPIGTATDYTPATIQVGTAPTTWGSVTIRPVAQIQPFATSANALSYYWKVTSADFTGLQPNSISHTYRFVNSDLVPIGDEANYIPAAYRPFSWAPINDPSKVTDTPLPNTILFNNISFVDGDYTAGLPTAFQAVKVFYSRQTGSWTDPNTWSSVAVGGAVDGSLPGAMNPVVIGDGSINHIVTVPIGTSITVGGLQINTGSTLDIQTTTGHNLGAIPDTKVSGTGTLRISSAAATATFPGGDFGNFLSDGGGTVEYYSTATLGINAFMLPSTYSSGGRTININSYNNLVTSPAAGKTISLPDRDQTVYNTYTVGGSGVSQLNTTATQRTLTVNSKLEVLAGGTLRYPNGGAQSVVANGDVVVNGTFDVSTGGAATNSLTLFGNLTNNGTFDMYTGVSQVCNVTFAGNTDKEINGTCTTTDFNTIIVNKGSSRNTLLEVKSTALSLNTSLATALTLTNGTFRLTSPITLPLTNLGSFTIPISGSLSANGGTINIGGGSANNDTDLKLDGRLEVLAGAINIGTSGNNLNNDIEYSSGGYPEIIVNGGSLYVNGQIRRVTTINTGSLNYTQSNDASTVTIAGRNANATRGMLEILNAGSKFDMSGGTLNITGSFNTSASNDLYLAPDSSTVTGGTILFGSSVTPANIAFNMVTSVPLYNVAIDATTNPKTLDLRIYPLTLKSNLTINGNSVFRANGLNVTIAGNLTNNNSNAGQGINSGGYQSGSTTQLTTFNGTGISSITGAGANLTNFANLTVDKSGSLLLSPSSNVRVNSNLSINSGTLDDGGNTISVTGNVDNNATHASSIAGGGIFFQGSQPQVISGSGTGTFGNVTLDNTTGISMVDNSVINGALTFTNGKLYIDDYLLTFGVNATIGGTPDATKMILLNGVISDAGVKKIYPSGVSNFTYPIGVAGKYTPATYNFTANANSNASITAKLANFAHPALANPIGDELKYYWNVVSNGFTIAPTINHTYKYLGSDVTGDENTYVTGRFLAGVWNPLAGIPGTVTPATHQINLGNVSYIDGEYTAGVSTNFTPNLPILYSIKSGAWNDPLTWSSISNTGVTCNCIPNGNPVIIAATHTVTITADGADAYSVHLNGTLDIGTTVFHSIGHVSGGGKLNISSTVDGFFVFPGGNYDVFMATTGSTIEFMGNNESSLPLKPGNNYKPYQNVIFSGTGKKLISAEDLKVLSNLTIKDGSTILSNEQFNRKITILGSWTDNNSSAVGGFLPGYGTVDFNGTTAQTLTVTNAATTERFYNLKINNPAGLTINGGGKADVAKYLYLTNGNITTTTALLSISNTSPSAVVGGGSGSFVNGPLQKKMLAGGNFNFPVGDAVGTRYGKVTVSEASVAGNYIAQYYNHNPLTDGYNPATKTAPVDVVSNLEYWRVNGPATANANVTVRWDAASGIIPIDAATRKKLRIVEWNPSWITRGGIVTDGGTTSGTIKTSPIVSVAGDHRFTIGVESLPTATITSGDANICNDGSYTTVNIALTGTGPWTIKYKINGANETTINNIATSPYPLVVSNAIPALAAGGPGAYAFTASYIKDATGSTGIRDFVTSATITLNASPTPVISGLTTTPANSTVTYSTPNIAGHTYAWTVAGGAIQSGAGTNQISVKWGAGPTGTVTLTETVTVGGCWKTTPDYNVTITDIPAPIVSGNDVVCNGATETYTTPSVSGHTYVWAISGGTIASGQNTNQITATWTTSGAGWVRVTETGSSSVPNTLNVTVNPLPLTTNAVSDPTICSGTDANIVITGAPAGITYQLRNNVGNTLVGTAVSSGPGGDVTLTVTPTGTTTYNIWATNEYTCGVQLTDLATVTVKPSPAAVATSSDIIACSDRVGHVFSVTNNAAWSYAWTVQDAAGLVVAPGTTSTVTLNWKSNSAIFIDPMATSIAKTVTVTVTADGCPTVITWDVTVHRRPESGPVYHVPNI